ncbi:MAG: hypothetical protein WCJ82_02695 [Actinomycetota bacterium]
MSLSSPFPARARRRHPPVPPREHRRWVHPSELDRFDEFSVITTPRPDIHRWPSMRFLLVGLITIAAVIIILAVNF